MGPSGNLNPDVTSTTCVMLCPLVSSQTDRKCHVDGCLRVLQTRRLSSAVHKHLATVHNERLTRYPTSCIRDQEGNDRADVGGFTDATKGHRRRHLRLMLFPQSLRHHGADDSRSNRVHANL